jgi:hypothetical protein
VAAAPGKPDAEAIKRSFVGFQREYSAFRRRYGDRFQAEYDEILDLQTFGGSDKLGKLDARMDALRKRMAEVSDGE